MIEVEETDLEQFLRTCLTSDGNIKMTKGLTSDLTRYFTSILLVVGPILDRDCRILNPHQREALIQHYGHADKSWVEIGKMLHIPWWTAKRCGTVGFRKVMARMRQIMREHE